MEQTQTTPRNPRRRTPFQRNRRLQAELLSVLLVAVVAVFVVYVLGYYYVYGWIVTKTNPFAKKAVVADVALQEAIAVTDAEQPAESGAESEPTDVE